MPIRGGLASVIPDWASKVLLTIVGVMVMYVLNQKTGDIEAVKRDNQELRKELTEKLDKIIMQNGDTQGDLKLINSKLSDYDARFADYEKRLRELELDKARNGR